MATKYYYTLNANSPIVAGDKKFTFELCAMTAGSFYGIYASDNAEDQKLLDEAPAAKECDEATYNSFLKKKPKFQATNWSRSKPLGKSHERENASPVAREDKTHAQRAEEAKPVEEISNTESTEEELGEAVPVESEQRVISYKDLAKALDVDVKWLKKVAKREDSPKRESKGFLVSVWQAFTDKVKAEETD